MRAWGLVALAVFLSGLSWAEGGGLSSRVLELVRSLPEGGGYNASGAGSGTLRAVTVNSKQLLPAGTEGTYCSGITFQVLVEALQPDGLVGFEQRQLRELQNDWYGRTQEAAEKQCVYALEKFALGYEVAADQALAGDFVQFWRKNSGHSAIFLGWVLDPSGRRIGLRFRGSQGSTKGIADRTEFFIGQVQRPAIVLQERIYLGRLDPSGAAATRVLSELQRRRARGESPQERLHWLERHHPEILATARSRKGTGLPKALMSAIQALLAEPGSTKSAESRPASDQINDL